MTKISHVQRNRLYNPLTPSGTIVVDGVVASAYVSFQEDAPEYVERQGRISTMVSYHNYIHLVLSPFRLICMMGSMSPGLICTSYNDEGLPPVVSFGMNLIKWANRQNIVVQSLVLLAIAIVSGICTLVEVITIGTSWRPLLLLFVTATGLLVATISRSGRHQFIIQVKKEV